MRSDSMIWKYHINNYLKGEQPQAFDVLFWNADTTRLPAQMYIDYLQNCIRDNLLVQKNKMNILNKMIDLSLIDAPCFIVGAEKDHIVPKESLYLSTKYLKKVEFITCGSGHTIGIFNLPQNNKYHYSTNKLLPKTYAQWQKEAHRTLGSWWTHWNDWCLKHAGDLQKSITMNDIKKYIIEPAPGRYVVEQ